MHHRLQLLLVNLQSVTSGFMGRSTKHLRLSENFLEQSLTVMVIFALFTLDFQSVILSIIN